VGKGVGWTGFTSSVTTIGVDDGISIGPVSRRESKVLPEKINIRHRPKQQTDRTRRTVMIMGRAEDLVFMEHASLNNYFRSFEFTSFFKLMIHKNRKL
jgi:hypothetical protein